MRSISNHANRQLVAMPCILDNLSDTRVAELARTHIIVTGNALTRCQLAEADRSFGHPARQQMPDLPGARVHPAPDTPVLHQGTVQGGISVNIKKTIAALPCPKMRLGNRHGIDIVFD